MKGREQEAATAVQRRRGESEAQQQQHIGEKEMERRVRSCAEAGGVGVGSDDREVDGVNVKPYKKC